MLTTTRCGNQAHEHALAHRLDCLHTTRTGDDVAELAEANMSGRVDGALGRQLPDGIDWLATPEWIDAYHAGADVAGRPDHADVDSQPRSAVRRCNMCHHPTLGQVCGPCRREAAGL
jgi:hypothetical protein